METMGFISTHEFVMRINTKLPKFSPCLNYHPHRLGVMLFETSSLACHVSLLPVDLILRTQCLGRVWGILGQHPSVSKSNRLH